MIRIEFLKRTDVFKDIDDDRLKTILGLARYDEFKNNDRIFTHGADATNLWILYEGAVELRSEPPGRDIMEESPAVSFISEAQTFGWTCFVPPYKYRLSGYCASEACKIINFKKEDLLSVFESDNNIGFHIMLYLIKTVGWQFEQLQDEIAKRRGMEVLSRW